MTNNLQKFVDKLMKSYNEERADTNDSLEREYFSSLPMVYKISELKVLCGHSYQDVLYASQYGISRIKDEDKINIYFQRLVEAMYFSAGHDLLFKKKLEADMYAAPILKSVAKILEDKIKENYNDFSVDMRHPYLDKNLNSIWMTIKNYYDMSDYIYMLYASDWMVSESTKQSMQKANNDAYDILINTDITIGEILDDLIDYKCDCIRSVMDTIGDKNLRHKYCEKTEQLRESKKRETRDFNHVNLPVGYFLTHSFMDYTNMERQSSLLVNQQKKTRKKIVLH